MERDSNLALALVAPEPKQAIVSLLDSVEMSFRQDQKLAAEQKVAQEAAREVSRQAESLMSPGRGMSPR